MRLLPGPRRVVEGPQHAGDVTQGEVRDAPLGEGAQRLALEVEQDPATAGDVQHLAEVVVAVDALQGRPGGGRGREEDLARGLVVGWPARGPRCWRWRGGTACWPAGRPGRSRSPGRWACTSASVACTSAVADPRARARSLKSSSRATASAATRQASSTPGRNSWANARCPTAVPPGRRSSGHSPETWPNGLGTSVEPPRARADCTTTSGLSPWCRTRNTLQINGCGTPSSVVVS